MIDKLLFIGNSHIDQFTIPENKNKFKELYSLQDIQLLHSPGVSIRGLNKKNSTLGFCEKIIDFKKNNLDYYLIFFLGQVDLEFGYYYKCVKQNIKINVVDYIEETANIYINFLNKEIKDNFCIVSINPSTINDTEHNFNVNFKDITPTNFLNDTGNSANTETIFFNDVKHFYSDSLEDRNKNHLFFNEIVKYKANQNNYKFVNLWDDISENNIVKPQYNSNKNDHHLVPSEDMFHFLMKKIL